MDPKFFRKYADIVSEAESADDSSQVSDDWFKTGSFRTFKKPAVEKYEVA
jgi:hypothetical protein